MFEMSTTLFLMSESKCVSFFHEPWQESSGSSRVMVKGPEMLLFWAEAKTHGFMMSTCL